MLYWPMLLCSAHGALRPERGTPQKGDTTLLIPVTAAWPIIGLPILTLADQTSPQSTRMKTMMNVEGDDGDDDYRHYSHLP